MSGFGFGFVFRSPMSFQSRILTIASAASLLALLAPAEAEAGVPPPVVVEGQIVLQVGDTPTGGAAVTSINSPYVNDAGEVAFVGEYDDGDNFIYIGGSVVWQGTDDGMLVLDALEARVDSDAAGNWVYAIDIDGADGLYSSAGYFAAAGEQAPEQPMGNNYAFLGNVAMLDDGSFYFVAGIDETGDGLADYRVLYYTPDGTPGASTAVVTGGTALDMQDLTPNGIDFDYAVSRDGSHIISSYFLAGFPDAALRVDDAYVALTGDPTGDGDNWDNFELVAVNNAGNYVFSGDTDGFGATDDFLAYNGTIAVRQGNTIGPVQIGSQAEVRVLSINDLEQVIYAWAYQGPAGFRETMFFACNSSDIEASSQVLFSTTDDSLDADGDGAGDYTITDIVTNGPTIGRALGNTGVVYAALGLDDGSGEFDAMVEIPVTCCGNGMVDPAEDCDDGNDDDTDECVAGCIAATCGDGFVQDGVEDCDDGNDDDTDECVDGCVAASCGDGFVQDGREECDDGNDDDTDECVAGCVEAACGDGFVQDGVEECDDGNRDDGDDCRNDCTLADGVDETGDSGEGTTGGSGGATGAGPNTNTASNTNGNNSADDGADTGETDTDTDSVTAGGVGDPGGCDCRTDGRSAPSPLWTLFGLGLLGLRRRRRH